MRSDRGSRKVETGWVPRQVVYRHFVYTDFVYYCIPAYRTVILVHPTSVSAIHYFHQFQLLFTYYSFLSIPLPLTIIMIMQHI